MTGSGPGRTRFVVRGRVQGVGFRWFVQREGAALGLTGWVRNLHDGTVEAVAEGPADLLEDFLAVLKDGPAAASVTDVQAFPEKPTGEFAEFSIQASR